jgi:hypothetical protein
MPLLDHFHPPLHGPRRWEGFHHAWATSIAHQLNQDVLPPDYFAEPEISIGPEFEVDVATIESMPFSNGPKAVTTATWTPARAKFNAAVDYSRLDTYEVRVYQDLGGAQLRGAVEIVSPANKDRAGHRLTFAAKCAGYLQKGIGVMVIDVVTERSVNLHEVLFDVLEVKTRRSVWKSSTNLYAIAYRPVTVRKSPRVEVWAESLALNKALPTLPLWLALDLCVPVRLEDSYLATCNSLRISA